MKRLAVVLACSIALCGASRSAPAAGLDKAAVFDLFSQGKEALRQANEKVASDPAAAKDLYGRAALRFERIVHEGGVRNGKLFYNIGNIHFRLGDVGRAILYYRRAEQLIPNDPNLRQNLGYARARRVDKVDVKERTKVLKTLFFWHYDLSGRARLVLFAVLFGLVWVLAATRLFRPGAAPRWGIVLAGIVAALLFGSLLTDAVGGSQRAGAVLAPEVVARKGDAETYQPSFTEPLHAGTEFELLEDRGEWLHIELADGRRCWVARKAVGLVGAVGQ